VSEKIRKTSKRRPWPDPGWSARGKKKKHNVLYAVQINNTLGDETEWKHEA
jgi:hypothetical protein